MHYWLIEFMKICSLHRLHTFNEFCSCYQIDEISLSPKENKEGNAASSLKKAWVTLVSDQSDTKSVSPHQIFTRVRRGQIPQPLSDSNVLAIECLHRLNLISSDYLDGCKNTHFILWSSHSWKTTRKRKTELMSKIAIASSSAYSTNRLPLDSLDIKS